MSNDPLEIRKLTPQDLDQYNNLLRYAFQVTEKVLVNLGWESDEIRQAKTPVLEHANVIGFFDGDTLISQFAVYPTQMNIHDTIYPIGIITSVATYPEYSGLGLMSKLMKQSLNEMRRRKQTLALLYPFSIPLYRHRGWEIISDKMTFSFKVEQLSDSLEAPGYVRRVANDCEDLLSLHTRFAKETHGCLFRNSLVWEEYWRWDVDDTIVAIYYNQSDEPQGYMVYHIDSDIMSIKEMAYMDLEARKGLFQYIAAHVSMIDEVRGNNYTSTPIAFSMYDGDIKETIRPYMMGRIVDFEGFIQQYTFDCSAPDVTITFDISDPFLEWNNDSFTLVIQNGKGRLIQEDSNHRVSLSINTLTTLLLGYKRATELFKLEMLDTDPSTLRLLDNLLIQEKPYISDYI